MDAAPPSFRRRSLSALVFLAAFALRLGAARAAEPSPEVLAKITNLNKKAVAAYQKEDFDSARDLLKQALEACNAAHLEHHPITARTEIHIGVLLIGGLKQHSAGVKHFQKALQIQPDIQITKTLVTPELQDAFEEAVLGADSGGGAGGGDEGGATKRRPPPSDDEGGGASEGGGDSADEDRPSRKKIAGGKKKPPRKRSGDDDEGGEGGGDEGDEGGGGGKIYIGLMFGTGFGTISGSGETTGLMRTDGTKVTHAPAGGFALAQALQIAPEVGYFLKPNLMLSLELRYQIITGTNPPPGSSEPTSAIAGMVRGTYFFSTSGFQPFIAVGLGGGYIRHSPIAYKRDPVCGPNRNESCVEVFKGGPILVGPGAGFHYGFGHGPVSLVVQLNTQVGLPNFTFNIDGQLGLALRF